MRITIDIDGKGNGAKLVSAEDAADIPVIDAGPAPIEHVKRLSSMMAAADGGGMSLPLATDIDAKQPLNPLRAGAAAARQTGYVDAEPSVATSVPTTDGGRAAHLTNNTLPPATAPVAPPAKAAKSRAKAKR